MKGVTLFPHARVCAHRHGKLVPSHCTVMPNGTNQSCLSDKKASHLVFTISCIICISHAKPVSKLARLLCTWYHRNEQQC